MALLSEKAYHLSTTEVKLFKEGFFLMLCRLFKIT